ncbi:MAG: LEA type 2 family protein [Candidatus Scalindua sp.]|nr:LEA type 2 family protein [Candidatus Scalindua sp.]
MVTCTVKIKKMLLAVFFVSVCAGCAATGRISESPYISLSNIELVSMGVFEQRYRIMLRIKNPNDISIPIKGMSYTIFLNGKEFANGVSNKPVIIPEYGEEVIEIEATSDLTGILNQLQELISGGIEKVSYRLAGRAKLSNRIRRLSYEYKGELDLQPVSGDGSRFFLHAPQTPEKMYSLPATE